LHFPACVRNLLQSVQENTKVSKTARSYHRRSSVALHLGHLRNFGSVSIPTPAMAKNSSISMLPRPPRYGNHSHGPGHLTTSNQILNKSHMQSAIVSTTSDVTLNQSAQVVVPWFQEQRRRAASGPLPVCLSLQQLQPGVSPLITEVIEDVELN
jgi:hypothetical protein